MRFQTVILSTILISTIILTGCPGNQANGNSNSQNTTANTAGNENNDGGFVTGKKTPEPTSNQAPTLTPVFKAYCDAMTRKDEAALRKVYSQAALRAFDAKMKEEDVKTLVEYMEVEQVSNRLCEVRNEKIEGDRATAEVRTEGSPNGVRAKFVKENGEWKMTGETDDFDSVDKSASNAAR